MATSHVEGVVESRKGFTDRIKFRPTNSNMLFLSSLFVAVSCIPKRSGGFNFVFPKWPYVNACVCGCVFLCLE